MANTFKNASLVSVNHAALATLYTCPASTTAIILGLALTNKTDNSDYQEIQEQVKAGTLTIKDAD